MYALIDSPVGQFVRTRPEALTETAEHDPFAIAVATADRHVTYGELDVWSSKLADLLVGLGAGETAHVVMAVPASIESIVSMWAVAKTGASLASIDHTDGDVLAAIGSDWRISVGVTTKALRPYLPDSVAWLVLDDASTVVRYMADLERAA